MKPIAKVYTAIIFLFPVTGISLPFFSSGGSALIIQMAEMGLILSISRQNPVT